MNPRVRNVVPKDDYKLEIRFTNGEVGTFDCAHLVDFGVFREFQDIGYFKRARVEHGTVVWPHEQDICPDKLYEDSMRVSVLNAERTHPLEQHHRDATAPEERDQELGGVH
jgi:hypothetical protein